MEPLKPLPVGTIILQSTLPTDVIQQMSIIKFDLLSFPSRHSRIQSFYHFLTRNKLTFQTSTAIQAKLSKLNLQVSKDIPEAIELSKSIAKQCLLSFVEIRIHFSNANSPCSTRKDDTSI